MSTTYQDLQFTAFPNAIQSFVTMLNMVAADAPAVLGFQEAMEQGDTPLAQQFYSQITNANQKFIDATKMNTLMDTCIALQRFYQTDIQPFITSKQTEWTNRIDQFNYTGAYSPSVAYEVNNFVTYSVNGVNNVYICIAETIAGTAPTNSTYWRMLSIRGMPGESGPGLSFRYEWVSDATYYVGDVVTWGNTVWGCTQQNINQAPMQASPYWQFIYSPQQIIYPFQATEPTSANQGDLWLEPLT